jgi:hypothetical protein
MNRIASAGLALALVALAGCGKQEEQAPAAPQVAPQAAPVAPAPPPQAVGESCSQDCGGGTVISIQCAEGETPVCDCAAQPQAVCQVPETPAS